MSAHDDISRLLKEAAASMKADVKGAVAKLEEAFVIASGTGVADDAAVVAEELARGWARRKSAAKALYYARKATRLVPDHKSTWTTLAKTCEMLATRTRADTKQGRARALYRAAAQSFKKASALAKDPEDKHWLIELARDANAQSKPPAA